MKRLASSPRLSEYDRVWERKRFSRLSAGLSDLSRPDMETAHAQQFFHQIMSCTGFLYRLDILIIC